MAPRRDGKMLALALLLLSGLWFQSNFVEIRHSSMCGPRPTRSIAGQGRELQSLLIEDKSLSTPEGAPETQKSSSVLKRAGIGLRSVLEKVGSGFRFTVDARTPTMSSDAHTVLQTSSVQPEANQQPSPVQPEAYQQPSPVRPEANQQPTTESSSRSDVLRNGLLVAGGIALGLQLANSSREEEERKKRSSVVDPMTVLPLVAGSALLLVGLQAVKAAKDEADRKKKDDEIENKFGIMFTSRFLEGRREPFDRPGL